MREYQRKRRALALRALALKLLAAGVEPEKIGRKTTLRQRLSEMRLDRDALRARVEWQSSGIRGLREELATARALLATQPVMEETELRAQLLAAQQRITALEAQGVLDSYARAEAILDDQRRELLEEEL